MFFLDVSQGSARVFSGSGLPGRVAKPCGETRSERQSERQVRDDRMGQKLHRVGGSDARGAAELDCPVAGRWKDPEEDTGAV